MTDAVTPQIVHSADWHVRPAEQRDVDAVAVAVAALLSELGSTPPPKPALLDATQALLDDPLAGVILIAEADGALVGVLAASWQSAIHIPGRYGLIQDLWVQPAWRSSAIGGALVGAFVGLAREQRVARIEVGLPKPSFTHIVATEAFYVRNGFDVHGTRMRMSLA
jgi:GNAT superfamily N-acetyltransferase